VFNKNAKAGKILTNLLVENIENVNFMTNLKKTDMKIKHLIDVITTALEFEGIPIRHAEDKILKALCE